MYHSLVERCFNKLEVIERPKILAGGALDGGSSLFGSYFSPPISSLALRRQMSLRSDYAGQDSINSKA
jgi:hypothetical protein